MADTFDPARKAGFIGRFICRLTWHLRAGFQVISTYASNGSVRVLYRCKKCGDYYSEKW